MLFPKVQLDGAITLLIYHLEHPDIEEFLEIGTEGNPIQDLTHGVTVTDKWMEEMVAGDQDKRRIWAKVIQRRRDWLSLYHFY